LNEENEISGKTNEIQFFKKRFTMKEDKKSGSAGAMMKRDASVDTLDYRK